jgi:GTP-sensing pleiotropic transcriptional regulator CodY
VPGKERDEESGKYTTSYSASDFLDAIQQLDGIGGTSEIAEKVGCTRRTAYTRLRELEEQNKVVSRKIGSSVVWSLPE